MRQRPPPVPEHCRNCLPQSLHRESVMDMLSPPSRAPYGVLEYTLLSFGETGCAQRALPSLRAVSERASCSNLGDRGAHYGSPVELNGCPLELKLSIGHAATPPNRQTIAIQIWGYLYPFSRFSSASLRYSLAILRSVTAKWMKPLSSATSALSSKD